MTELLQAARIAEMATPSTDSGVSAVLDELRATSAQHTAAFQQLSTRLDKLSITPIDQRHDDASSRRPSPSRTLRRQTYAQPVARDTSFQLQGRLTSADDADLPSSTVW